MVAGSFQSDDLVGPSPKYRCFVVSRPPQVFRNFSKTFVGGLRSSSNCKSAKQCRGFFFCKSTHLWTGTQIVEFTKFSGHGMAWMQFRHAQSLAASVKHGKLGHESPYSRGAFYTDCDEFRGQNILGFTENDINCSCIAEWVTFVKTSTKFLLEVSRLLKINGKHSYQQHWPVTCIPTSFSKSHPQWSRHFVHPRDIGIKRKFLERRMKIPPSFSSYDFVVVIFEVPLNRRHFQGKTLDWSHGDFEKSKSPCDRSY